MSRRNCPETPDSSMTTQEAKLILQAYRPGSEDEEDPFFADALELARADKELGEWFARQCEFDRMMGSALQSEIPPSGLRDAILARKTHPLVSKKAKPFHVLSILLSGAAAIVLFVGIALFHGGFHNGSRSADLTVAAFTREALDIKEQGRVSLATKSTDPAQLRKWLAERGAPNDFVVPPGLNGIPSLGCQSYEMGGTKVTLICFDLGNNQVAHLFVIDKSALTDASQDSRPELREENGLAFATWTSGNKSYVLTGDNITRETIQKLI